LLLISSFSHLVELLVVQVVVEALLVQVEEFLLEQICNL
jgi:hypothetical protein